MSGVVITNDQIKEIALANGFVLKPQVDGSMALHPYVYEFSRALLAAAPTPPAQEVEPIKETDAFEKWAASEKMEMSMHPLHYLFLDNRTYAARQGWKAALRYTAPPNDELRKAAEHAFRELESRLPFLPSWLVDMRNELSAALDKQ